MTGRTRRGAETAVWLIAGLALTSALTGCTPREPRASVDVVDLDVSVERSLVGYLEAISSRDSAAIRALYVDDGRFSWIEDGSVRYRSADEVLSGLEAFPVEMAMETTLGEVSVVPVGDSGAYAWAAFETSIGDGPAAFSFGGMLSFVLERRDEGWVIVGGHTSSPRE